MSNTRMRDSSTEAVAAQANRTWRAVSVAMVGTFMAILDVFIVLIAAPAIQRDLHASDAEIQFVLAGYQLTYAVVLITAGRLGDLYGRKLMFQVGLAVFTAASLACGLAGHAGLLIGARLVQGIGSALMFPQVFAFVNVLTSGRQRHQAFGVLGAVIGLSTIVGQLVGGLLIQADILGTSWRPVFWINVPIGLITLVLAARFLPESRASGARRLDLLGVAVLTPALFLLVVPLIEGRELGWPTWTWVILAGSGLCFVLFALVERWMRARGRSPLLELRLFRAQPFTVGMTLVLVYYAALNSFFLVLSLMLQDGLGLSAVHAGLIYAPQAIVFFLASLLAGRLAPRYGRGLLVAGGAITALGFASTVAVAFASGASLSASAILPTLLVQGLGEGFLQTPLINSILSRVGEDTVGMVSGVLSTAQQVGGALGIAIIGVLFFGGAGGAEAGDAGTFSHAFGVAVVFNTVVAVIVTALVFGLPARADRESP
jgi:EmrB/QacA subfamily drug resistance transporter